MPVKPISDRMKQSLFDILRPRITASCFLDLFAGTGSVGLEAISRGAMQVVFVERDTVCLKVIDRNLERLGFAEKAKTLRAEITQGVGWLRRHCAGEGFDIIFMGPPYRDEKNRMLALTGPVLKSIAETGILAEAGIVIAQHHATEVYEIPPGFEKYRQEKYGDTLITFLRRAKAAQ